MFSGIKPTGKSIQYEQKLVQDYPILANHSIIGKVLNNANIIFIEAASNSESCDNCLQPLVPLRH